MVTRTYTTAFEGMEGRLVEVQCSVSEGMPAFSVVGLPDKAVSEARDRVRAAFEAMGVMLPAKKVTLNLSPADLPKQGSHYDLPIALALLGELGVLARDVLEGYLAMGELSLDGRLIAIPGALPGAMVAAQEGLAMLCPAKVGAEAAWVGAAEIYAPDTIARAIDHVSGRKLLPRAEAGEVMQSAGGRDLGEVKGQTRAKRALELAAAGRHHLLMTGAPGDCVPLSTPRRTRPTSCTRCRANCWPGRCFPSVRCPRTKCAASRMSRSVPHRGVRSVSARSTRRMCSKPRSCGATW